MQIKSKAINDFKIKSDDLWFNAGGGIFRITKNSFSYLTLDTSKSNQGSPFTLSRFATYCILKDKKGNLWFGSQAQSVCRLDVSASNNMEKYITWFTEKGLAGPALALFEDSVGNILFGNNGGGLFKYDGKSLINFTEVKGLSNREFRTSGKSKPGTLARIYAINEDNNGDLWIGTVDSGVWRYDGNYLTNYTTKDGLTSNAVNTIYKDNNGELWFGTDSNGICKFNGSTFSKFIP